MIFRYIIFILIGCFIYCLIKKLFASTHPQMKIKNIKREEISEMVIDQNCGRYVLKSSALRLNRNGEDIFFCSEECLRNYKIKVGDR